MNPIGVTLDDRISIDVIDPDEREALLARTTWLYESLVESSTDAIITKTLQGRVTSWNRAADAYESLYRDAL